MKYLQRAPIAASIRFCLWLPAAAFLAFCLAIRFSNPNFADSVPFLFTAIGAVIGAILWLGLAAMYLAAASIESFRSRLDAIIRFVGSQKLSGGIMAFAVIAYSLLSAESYYHNQSLIDDRAPRLAVFGLDGATWTLIDPLMEAEKLPTLRRLSQAGSRGILHSLDPMTSPVLWASISTGLPPDKHGVTGFFSTRADLKAPRIWDLCRSNRLRVGLFGWLLTWPPGDPFSFEVPSWMARSPAAYPPEYACLQEIVLEQGRDGRKYSPLTALFRCARRGAGLRAVEKMLWFYLRDGWGLSEEAHLAEKMLAEVRLQTDLYIALMRRYRPDVTAFSLYGTDKLGHRFWHSMKPESFDGPIAESSRFRHIIEDYYQEADQALGRILSVFPLSANIVILSDHGMKADTALPRQFFLDAAKFLRALGAEGLFHYAFVNRQLILEPIRAGHELKPWLEKIEAVRFSDSQEPLFQVREEEGKIWAHTDFSLTWNPDSPLLQHESIAIADRSYPTSSFFFSRTFSGEHDPAGIVILAGQDVKRGAKLMEANLLDIAPTILYLLSLPISREMTGRILEEALAVDKKPVYVDRYEPSHFQEGEIITPMESYLERLRSVGYIE
ncbi:MAG: alkaline phosphatase family protein [Candidatus Omnitrophota bacterium]